MSDRRTDDAKLIEAVRLLSRTIQTGDGVIGACLAEVATRLAELVEERRGFLTPLEVTGLMRICGFLTLNNVQEGASIVRGILERNGTKPTPMMSPKPLPLGPGPEGEA